MYGWRNVDCNRICAIGEERVCPERGEQLMRKRWTRWRDCWSTRSVRQCPRGGAHFPWSSRCFWRVCRSRGDKASSTGGIEGAPGSAQLCPPAAHGDFPCSTVFILSLRACFTFPQIGLTFAAVMGFFISLLWGEISLVKRKLKQLNWKRIYSIFASAAVFCGSNLIFF